MVELMSKTTEKIKEGYAKVRDKNTLYSSIANELNLRANSVRVNYFSPLLSIPDANLKTVLRHIERQLKKEAK